MAESFIGQLMLFAGSFVPVGWIPCDGRTLAINQYSALFAVIGTAFPGGNGTTNFALPDLRGRVPVGTGQGLGLQYYPMGQMGGAENVTLTTAQMPAHNHNMQAANVGGDTLLPDGAFLASTTDPISSATMNTYNSSLSPLGTLGATSISSAGSSQGHPNLQPYTTLQWCICNQGIFPTRS